MHKGSPALCVNSTFTPELYEDDFTAANAIKLIKRAPTDRPWFLHVSFPGPHDPFLVTTDMRNAASDGRNWPQPKDDPENVRLKIPVSQFGLRNYMKTIAKPDLWRNRARPVARAARSLHQQAREHAATMRQRSKTSTDSFSLSSTRWRSRGTPTTPSSASLATTVRVAGFKRCKRSN